MSKRAPYTFAAPAADAPKYWRSLEERSRALGADVAIDAERQKALAAEFPAGHTSMPPSEEAVALGRRGFMTVVGAALALVGAEGCRRPLEKVIPYAKMPEEVIPGIPSFYATVYNRRGESLGLLVECHEGRPTKIEGNPLNPTSSGISKTGGADLIAQASVLDLYDPDRSSGPIRKKDPNGEAFEKRFVDKIRKAIESEKEMAELRHSLPPEEYEAKFNEKLKQAEEAPDFAERRIQATWAFFESELSDQLRKHDRDRGDGLRFLMAPTNSPTVMRIRDAVAARYPQARFHWWAPVNESNVREGSRFAFGQVCNTVYAYDQADVVVSLDSDFLQTEPGAVAATKGYSARRKLPSVAKKGTMNRLYVVEPSLTTTGSNADHRLRLAASDIEKFALALAAKLAENKVVQLGELAPALSNQALPAGVPQAWIDELARDLAESRGRAIVVVGSRQPPTLHALAHALNEALGTPMVTHRRVLAADLRETAPGAPPSDGKAVLDIKPLVDRLSNGLVETLIILGGNPVYDAPADLKFGEALAKARFSVHVSGNLDETGEKCTWSIPRAHEFEAWGDQQSLLGRISIQQPLIQPIHGGWSDIQVLATVAQIDKKPYDLVRDTTRDWLRITRAPVNIPPTPLRDADLEREWKTALRDGCFAERGMAQPQLPLNPRGVADALAKRGALPESPTKDKIEITFAPCPKMFDGRHATNAWLLELPDPTTRIVWDNAALISMATAKALGIESGDNLKITVNNRVTYFAAWVMPGQADNSIALTLGWGRRKAGRIGSQRGFDAYPIRSSDALGFVTGLAPKPTFAKFGDKYPIGQTQEHNNQEGRPIAIETTFAKYKQEPYFPELQQPPPKKLPLWTDQDYVLDTGLAKGPQWGMTIDLNACTGCNACAIACQSENNVPVVGKTEVTRGREMHWLRVDRYFVDAPERNIDAEKKRKHVPFDIPFDDLLVAFQPLACVHCEEAPCENVCPVNATVHSPEGLNEMAYNRCIGTRYCANNCPYKVRRFNYLNWHNDGVWTFAEPFPELLHLQQNPDVTVRFRGVMEKCTYCVQRIQEAKIVAKREGREDKDGHPIFKDLVDIVTACQQTCPADAIVFGNLNDKDSLVAKLAASDRRYKLLGDLGTKPRTTYLGKVRNPNDRLAVALKKEKA